ncbi:MAG: alanyl-tRNA editing protein [Desulfurococcaceae archaeon]|uniref:Alanyl-tRNA editing protein n=1 Tax=Staphylothermus marinus TaxID=2280 RepID=A0A7C4D7Q2_STAMA
MTKLLYQEDSYLKEALGVIMDIQDRSIVLDQTIFHPRTGGLECDHGYIISNGKTYRVINVSIDKSSQKVIHELDSCEGLSPGSIVKQVLDWDRRYRMMKLHTSAHIISAIMYNKFNALATGGNITPEYAYSDFNLSIYEKTIFENVIEEANRVVKSGLEVKIYWLPREEALSIPGAVKLASRLPPELPVLRIVEIPGVDIQVDGGPHVKNTAEIGEIILVKTENKGKFKKRIYFTIK